MEQEVGRIPWYQEIRKLLGDLLHLRPMLFYFGTSPESVEFPVSPHPPPQYLQQRSEDPGKCLDRTNGVWYQRMGNL